MSAAPDAPVAAAAPAPAAAPAAAQPPVARSTLDDFVMRERIGSGSYGVVWRGTRKADGQTYALKEIDLHGMSKKVDCWWGLGPRASMPLLSGMHAAGARAPVRSSVRPSAPPPPHACLRMARSCQPQEQQECIQETRLMSEFDCDHIIKYWDAFLERVRRAAAGTTGTPSWCGCVGQPHQQSAARCRRPHTPLPFLPANDCCMRPLQRAQCGAACKQPARVKHPAAPPPPRAPRAASSSSWSLPRAATCTSTCAPTRAPCRRTWCGGSRRRWAARWGLAVDCMHRRSAAPAQWRCSGGPVLNPAALSNPVLRARPPDAAGPARHARRQRAAPRLQDAKHLPGRGAQREDRGPGGGQGWGGGAGV
jgi:hypothetical protein